MVLDSKVVQVLQQISYPNNTDNEDEEPYQNNRDFQCLVYCRNSIEKLESDVDPQARISQFLF